MPKVTEEDVSQLQQKLVGKKLHDGETTEDAFSTKELPKEHRVIGPDTMMTMDFRDDRYNVHVDDTGVVTHVTNG